MPRRSAGGGDRELLGHEEQLILGGWRGAEARLSVAAASPKRSTCLFAVRMRNACAIAGWVAQPRETPVDSLVPYVPPPPEEAIPTPPRFRVRYQGGEPEILAEGTPPEPLPIRWWRALRDALSDARATLRGDRPRIRLRAVLPATAAGALYRSIPEGTPLYVLHPGPQAAAPAPDGPSGEAPPPTARSRGAGALRSRG